MPKTTQKDLAIHIGMTPQGLTKMKKDHPKKFSLLWAGWLSYIRVNK